MPAKTIDINAAVSGHVWLYEGKRRKTWCAKWRDPTGQHEKRLGPAWTGKGSPAPGFLRERDAKALLDEILVEARKGIMRQQRTGVTFADVAEGWFSTGGFERDWSASTATDYRSVLNAHLLPALGALRIESITAKQIEAWRNELAADGTRVRHTVNKIAAVAHAVFEHAREHHNLQHNPVAQIKRLRESYDAARFDFFSPDEIATLARTARQGGHRDSARPPVSEEERVAHAREDEQDAVIYLTAAFSGLRRGELLALRWRDVDFEQQSIRVYEAYSRNELGSPKSRKSRTVPMIDQAGEALSDLKARGHHAGKDDLVFVNRDGGHVDGSALRRRYLAALEAAGLRRLRFHDLRHTFGSLAINTATIVQVQAWMGHADVKTTMRYLHHKSRASDARLLSEAFRPESDAA